MSAPAGTPTSPAADVRGLFTNASWLGGSTLVNAAVGFAFWIVAARLLDAETVGVEGTVLNVIMLLAWLCQLGMQSTLPRFVPVAGPGARGLVLRTYLAATVLALLCGLVWLVWSLAAGGPLFGLPFWLTLFSAASVLAWTIFSLQDSVLVGVRRPQLVAAENAVYSVLKLALLVPLALLLPEGALLVAWMLPVMIFIPAVSYYLFRRALPARTAGPGPVSAREVVVFVAHDLPGGAASMLAVRLVPVVVLAQVGGEETGYFLVAWQVLTVLELALSSLGLALTVEGSGAGDRATRVLARQLLRRVLPLAAVGSAVLVVLAGPVLMLFGPGYATQATTILQVLVCTLALRVVVDCAVSLMRVRSDLKLLLWIEVVRAPVALGSCWLLSSSYGAVGAAASYALTNVVLAVLAAAYLRHAFRVMAAADDPTGR